MRVVILDSLCAIRVLVGEAHASERYEGYRKCGSCHKSQFESWQGAAHADALESLKPNVKADAKRKANLDPAKDYRADPDCVGCHVTGYGLPGGFRLRAANRYGRKACGVAHPRDER